MTPFPFEELDFIYTPSRDVATDLAYFTDVLDQLARPEVGEHFEGRRDF